MPTPRYSISRIALATVSPIASRVLALSAGEGPSSQTFWWRRCKRAVALAEMDGVALAVAEHLDFDVAGALEIFLDIDGVIAERGLGLGARGRKRGRKLASRYGRPSCRGRRRRPPP